MTNTELLLLNETLKRSFQVSEYRTNLLGEEKSFHYKESKKKFITFVQEEGLKVKLIEDYPEEMEENICYVQKSGKWCGLKLERRLKNGSSSFNNTFYNTL